MMSLINRREFSKFLASVPFIGGLFAKSELLAQDKEFILKDELQNIFVRTKSAINDCQAFKIFNIEYFKNGELPNYNITENSYCIPNAGHNAERFIPNELGKYCPYFCFGSSINWALNTNTKYIDIAIDVFICDVIQKININAFNLLKYSGMANTNPDWSKLKCIYGTEKGIKNFLSKPRQSYVKNQQISFTTEIVDNGILQDNEVVGLSSDYKNHLFIPIRSDISIWTDSTLHRQMREGFYGWMEAGFINTDKNVCYYVDTNKI